MKNQKILIISGASGSGKNTVAEILLAKNKNLEETISCITRTPREEEKDGVHYYFISEEEFKDKIEKEQFLEWAKVHIFFYGTLKSEITKINGKGRVPLLVIDVQGAMNVKKIYPEAVLFFIRPASFEVLEKRIRQRAAITDKEVKIRLATAKKEIKMAEYYDHIIENPEGHPEKAAEKISDILEGYLK